MKDFVKALEKHAKVRFPKGERDEVNPDLNEPDEHITYWVCTQGGADLLERNESRSSRFYFHCACLCFFSGCPSALSGSSLLEARVPHLQHRCLREQPVLREDLREFWPIRQITFSVTVRFGTSGGQSLLTYISLCRSGLTALSQTLHLKQ